MIRRAASPFFIVSTAAPNARSGFGSGSEKVAPSAGDAATTSPLPFSRTSYLTARIQQDAQRVSMVCPGQGILTTAAEGAVTGRCMALA